jgi:translation elongation factor EF-G
MNEDTLNMEIRKFLKKVGISSQREIEHGVQEAINDGRLTGSETLPVRMTLEVPDLKIKHQLDGSINLE